MAKGKRRYDRKKEQYALHGPAPEMRVQLAQQWEKQGVATVEPCQYDESGIKHSPDVRFIPGVGCFCKSHFVGAPRCREPECLKVAILDPAINPDLLCRDHLMPDTDDGEFSPRRCSSLGW